MFWTWVFVVKKIDIWYTNKDDNQVKIPDRFRSGIFVLCVTFDNFFSFLYGNTYKLSNRFEWHT